MARLLRARIANLEKEVSDKEQTITELVRRVAGETDLHRAMMGRKDEEVLRTLQRLETAQDFGSQMEALVDDLQTELLQIKAAKPAPWWKRVLTALAPNSFHPEQTGRERA